jgi:hypothetical protein
MKKKIKITTKIILFLLFIILDNHNIIAKNDDIIVKFKITNNYGCSNCTYVAVKSTIESINTYLDYPELSVYACREIYALLKSSNMPNNVKLIKLEDNDDISLLEGLFITNKNNFPILYLKDFKSTPFITYLKILNNGKFYFKDFNRKKIYTDTSEKIISYTSLKINLQDEDSSLSIGLIEPNFNKIFIIKNGNILKEIPLPDTIKYFFAQEEKSYLKSEVDYFFTHGYFISSFKILYDFNDSTITVLCQSLFNITSKTIYDERIKEYVKANTPELRGLLLKYNYKNDKIEFIKDLDSSFTDYLTSLYYDNKIFFLKNEIFNILFSNKKKTTANDPIVLLQQIDLSDLFPNPHPLINYFNVKDIISFTQNKINQTISMKLNENILILNLFDKIILYDFQQNKLNFVDIDSCLLNSSQIKYPYLLNDLIAPKKYSAINNIVINDGKIYIFTKYYDDSRRLNYLTSYEFNLKFELQSFKFFDILALGKYEIFEPYILRGKVCLIGYDENKYLNIFYL